MSMRMIKSEKKMFSEQLWVMGKVMGTVKGGFTMSNLPVIQQMVLGILSETGIKMNSSPILLNEKDAMSMGLLKRT